jgi:GNAT superfamily N-acetyltransferase
LRVGSGCIGTVLGVGETLIVRRGRETDAETILGLWDAAIAWLVARGQTEQWGSEPASGRASCREAVQEWASGQGLRIAELDAEPVGASVVVESCPSYVPTTELRESYLLFLVADRAHAGHGVGVTLVEGAAREARVRGSQLLRVDCWAGAPDLVRWYERSGFVKTDTFTANDGWHGQVFEMML